MSKHVSRVRLVVKLIALVSVSMLAVSFFISGKMLLFVASVSVAAFIAGHISCKYERKIEKFDKKHRKQEKKKLKKLNDD